MCDAVQKVYADFKEELGKSPTDRQLYSQVPRVIVIVITKHLPKELFEQPLPMKKRIRGQGGKAVTMTTKVVFPSPYSIGSILDEFGIASEFNFLF